MDSTLNKISRELSLPKACWYEYFFTVALAGTIRSDCTRRQFGCIAVSPDNRIVAAGYNAPPAGELSQAQKYFQQHTCNPPKGFPCCKDPDAPKNQSYDSCNALHAEQNCLLQLGATNHYEYVDLYLAGRDGQTGELIDAGRPCIYCSRFIKNANVRFIRGLNADGSMNELTPDELVTTA
jgi:deoxycytidylate deaminase